MACQAVQTWGLSGLVAAFLDLAIAYLLLCGSALVYLASKFLGFFGLSLPCPCDGMFINFNNKSFCFDRLLIDFPTQKVSDVQICVKQKFPFCDYKNPKIYDYSVNSDDCVNGILKIEGEASCSSSASDARRSLDLVWGELSSRTGKYDVKGKGVLSHRPRGRLRHRKWDVDPPLPVEALRGEPDSRFGPEKNGNRFIEDDNKAPKRMRGRHRAITNAEINQSPDENMHIKKSASSIDEQHDSQQENESFEGDEKNRIQLLEKKLEEERIARAGLYVELEKERSAAATAADEAMAMILRLQEEKASLEMEAHQYQRMIEAKSAYDAEEMDILKEILVRREMEKHFLEKEVEAYRQMVSGENVAEQNFDHFLDPNDDPVSILHQLSASAENEQSDFEKKQFSNGKEIIFADKNTQTDESEQDHEHKLIEKIIGTCNINEAGHPNYDRSLKSSCDPTLDKDAHVYDVHIISDGTEAIEGDTKRSGSEIPCGLPPIVPKGLSSSSDSRRNSTSAMDSEMVKIDCEIGQLRERLKRVQQGREKLGLSLENQERGNVQLKLLEDIARQIQEIRRLTEPRKPPRQASLPPQTSKVLSRKRRSRSVSSSLQLSSEG